MAVLYEHCDELPRVLPELFVWEDFTIIDYKTLDLQGGEFMGNLLRNDLSATEKNGRREPREEVDDGSVEIDGHTYPVTNWSARGFMAKPCDVDCNIADELDVEFALRFANEKIEFGCRAIVVRIDKKRQELAAAYVMLDEVAQLAIAKHFGDGSTPIDELLAARP